MHWDCAASSVPYEEIPVRAHQGRTWRWGDTRTTGQRGYIIFIGRRYVRLSNERLTERRAGVSFFFGGGGGGGNMLQLVDLHMKPITSDFGYLLDLRYICANVPFGDSKVVFIDIEVAWSLY